MAALFRDPTILTFVDEDNRELGRMQNPSVIPGVGENVRLDGVPHVVERVGYDIVTNALERIWVVCRPV